ncbi:beta-mannosidase [Yoonia sp. 2307UL14-13]|uniref:beta-mannosidase n=1 Tax=Yoonia sp. 2307UL14-13 TaxID=3126506 RepID=UPI00309CA163
MTHVNLAGEWRLSDDSGAYTCPMHMPTDGITALHRAGLINDPYWGRNEYDLRWICERDWTATRTFDLTETDVDLVLSGVDTVVTVKVNDRVVLQAENAFRDYRVALTDAARVGTNTISVTFHSPVAVGAEKLAAHPFHIPNGINCPIPNGNMLRKPACDFGWDWNIALAPFGIYGTMAIEASDAPRIDRIMVAQDHDDDGVDLTLTVHVTGPDGDVTARIADQEVCARCVYGVCTLSVRIAHPRLWWPAGQGDQPLYDLEVTFAKAKATRRIGLRKMELVTETDAVGLGFKFRVNGRDVFAKGANWIPADALAGRITPVKTMALLQSAVDANMNMIRIWGGGRYEDDWFYDLCDELGLMVWQDFMFACNLYPSDDAFLDEVRAEAIDNVSRIHHHACLALWCGDNELVGALDWYDCSRKDRDRYLVNYDRLNRTLEVALKQTDPNANWWPSSPTKGYMNFGDAWHEDGSGDMHFWSVWHEGRDFEHYRDVSPRFCSEFGFQSYPSMRAVNRFAGAEDQNIAAPVLESHQKNEGGNARIAETLFRYFRWPKDFANFVYLSQVQQGLAIKTAVSHWRSLKPRCMGTLIWQLNDTWPVCSWSSLNDDGEWKLLHHMAKRFYAPVLVTAVPDGDEIILRAVNDLPEAVVLDVTAHAVGMDGSVRALGAAQVNVADQAVEAMRLPSDSVGDQEMVVFNWTGPNGIHGGDLFAPHPFKHYDLQPPSLQHAVAQEGADWQITLRVEALAVFVAVESDVPGRFSTNAIPLFPDYPITMTFIPDDPAVAPQFTFRDLHSATFA